LAQTSVITLKTQEHAVNARWKRLLQLSFKPLYSAWTPWKCWWLSKLIHIRIKLVNCQFPFFFLVIPYREAVAQFDFFFDCQSNSNPQQQYSNQIQIQFSKWIDNPTQIKSQSNDFWNILRAASIKLPGFFIKTMEFPW